MLVAMMLALLAQQPTTKPEALSDVIHVMSPEEEAKTRPITDPQVLSRMLAAARIQRKHADARARLLAAKLQAEAAERDFARAKTDLDDAQREYINLRDTWPGYKTGCDVSDEQKLVCPPEEKKQ